jgi:transcription elongation factor SPT4
MRQMRGQPERVAECTSINFDGMIAMMDPDQSWVAKWQRISTMTIRLPRFKAD